MLTKSLCAIYILTAYIGAKKRIHENISKHRMLTDTSSVGRACISVTQLRQSDVYPVSRRLVQWQRALLRSHGRIELVEERLFSLPTQPANRQQLQLRAR